MPESVLEKVMWTPELKDRRVPAFSHDGRKLNHWKAEEFSKFVIVAPIILCKLIPRNAYNCFCLLKDICDLVYSEITDSRMASRALQKTTLEACNDV